MFAKSIIYFLFSASNLLITEVLNKIFQTKNNYCVPNLPTLICINNYRRSFNKITTVHGIAFAYDTQNYG